MSERIDPDAIYLFFHCRRCLEELPRGVSPREWTRIEAGFTGAGGVKIWCLRHDCSIVHLVPEASRGN